MDSKDKSKPTGKKMEEDWLGGMHTANVDWFKIAKNTDNKLSIFVLALMIYTAI